MLARLGRDLTLHPKLAETLDPLPEVPKPGIDEALGGPGDALTIKGEVLLEEYAFTFKLEEKVATLADWLVKYALPDSEQNPEYDFWRNRLPSHLLILHDDVFTDFVRHATEVQARVKLNPDTKAVVPGGLFYQENLPADTVLYAAVLATGDLRPENQRPNGKLSADTLLGFVRELDGQRVQLGGDETVGKGICCAHFLA